MIPYRILWKKIMNRKEIIDEMTTLLQEQYSSEYALGYMTNFLGNCLESPAEATVEAMMERLQMVREDCS
jgi:hypothetical protein